MADASDVVSRRTVLAFLAGATLAGGAVGGAQLVAPPAPRSDNAALYVHQMRLEHERNRDVRLSVYSTSVFTRPDGGTKRRDNGEMRCDVPDAGRLNQLANRLESLCGLPAQAWAHVIEIRLAHPADSGFDIEMYASRALNDGGVLDMGRQPSCLSDAGQIETVLTKESIRCAEAVLDDP